MNFTFDELSIKQLKTELTNLKQSINEQELHIWNYFDYLKNKVDLAYETHRLDEENREYDITQIWTQVIDKIKQFEDECLKPFKADATFRYPIPDEINKRVEFFEEKINKLDETNKDELTSFNNEIYDELIKIEQKLFLNKSVIFIDKLQYKHDRTNEEDVLKKRIRENLPEDLKHLSDIYIDADLILFLKKKNAIACLDKFTSSKYLFTMSDPEISTGKLIIVKNQYFGKQAIQVFKMEQNNIFNKPRVTNENLKVKLLETQLESNLNDKDIEEIQLDFEQLKELSLSKLKLKEIDSNLFADLTCLNHISLSENLLVRLPGNLFHSLKQLKYVSLRKNDIVTIDANLFSESTELKEVHLSFNKLETIPSNLFEKNKKLEKCNLCMNKLESIDSHLFSGLTEMNDLNLAHNNITAIEPNAFKDLKKLQKLDLSQNHIKCLPIDNLYGITEIKDVIFDVNAQLDEPVERFRIWFDGSNEKAARIWLNGNSDLTVEHINELKFGLFQDEITFEKEV